MNGRKRAAVTLVTLSVLTAGDVRGAALDVLYALDGHWRGAGFTVTIDAARGQARLDPLKPFQWEAFNIRNIEGRMVVFSIGEQLFIGYLEDDRMTLTTPGRPASWTLSRRPEE